MSTVTARVSDETASRLDALAKATNRSKSFLVASALERFLEEQSWQIAQTIDSLEQADNGEFATSSEVQDAFDKWGLKVEAD
ncbi:CopG family ribbon-helix-helix protein [Desulfovibrio gilichinskyi]|uniref:Predicted transcriptional regulator n=1 Tax=Desulfovibrio gilichinskyi TaxID=1519643 RepID=A0A1X7CEC0_9BACT|nr:ribbon-helix-helix protein, CopG family [Desulfovibrio gilichinskyi]SME95219.1 Predicted transcriptional regulator [Desulfovibrio gilichinskyi]